MIDMMTHWQLSEFKQLLEIKFGLLKVQHFDIPYFTSKFNSSHPSLTTNFSSSIKKALHIAYATNTKLTQTEIVRGDMWGMFWPLPKKSYSYTSSHVSLLYTLFVA